MHSIAVVILVYLRHIVMQMRLVFVQTLLVFGEMMVNIEYIYWVTKSVHIW